MRRRNEYKTAQIEPMTKFQRKKVGLLFAGGTVLSKDPKPWEHVRKPSDMERWLEHVSELNVVTDVEPVFITGKNATEIGNEEWLAIAEAVKSLSSRVDGCIVLHAVETLHYTANALSLMLRSLPFPVIVSGSPLRTPAPGVKQVEFEARANIVNALQVATADISEVCVVFGSRIMKASRVQPSLEGGTFQLTTADSSLLGRLDFGTRLFDDRVRRGKRKPTWSIHLDPNVYVTTITPGSIATSIHQAVRSGVHAILVRAHELVSLPKEIDEELEAASEKGISVVVSSRNPLRPIGKHLIPLFGVTPSMAVVKVMWAIGNTRNPSALRKLLAANIAGEFMTGGGQ